MWMMLWYTPALSLHTCGSSPASAHVPTTLYVATSRQWDAWNTLWRVSATTLPFGLITGEKLSLPRPFQGTDDVPGIISGVDHGPSGSLLYTM